MVPTGKVMANVLETEFLTLFFPNVKEKHNVVRPLAVLVPRDIN